MNYKNKNGGKAAGQVFLRGLPLALGAGAALLLMAMMLLTFTDVIGRYFFDMPVNGAYEVTEVLLGFVVFFALPLVTLENGHVTVSLFDGWFRGAAKKAKALAINLIMVLVQGVMAWRLALQANDMMTYGDVSMFLHIPYGWVAYVIALLAGISTLFSLYLSFANIFRPEADGASQ